MKLQITITRHEQVAIHTCLVLFAFVLDNTNKQASPYSEDTYDPDHVAIKRITNMLINKTNNEVKKAK